MDYDRIPFGLEVGDCVAWRMADGNTMTGTVSAVGRDHLDVTRVDGGTCRIERPLADTVRLATGQDVHQAINFFKRSV